MLSGLVGLVVLSLGWASEEHDVHEDSHAHSHEESHSDADEEPHEESHEEPHEESHEEPTGCEPLPDLARQALKAHYEAQAQWEARQQEWAEDWGGAVFQFQEGRTRCVQWDDTWILYAFGGVYSSKAMVERHRWSENRLVKDGPTAPLLRSEMEKDVPLLRIDTAEGCCGSQWTQSSWYTEEGGMHRVLSLPVAIDAATSPWPVRASVIWSGPEWADTTSVEPMRVSVRYLAPTLGNREALMRGELQGPSETVRWVEPDSHGLSAELTACLTTRRPFCPLSVLQGWLNSQVGQVLPDSGGGAPRSLSGLESEFRLESVQLVGEGRDQVEATLKARSRQLLSCYERATRSGARVAGPLVISMDVAGGRVQDLSLDAAPDHPSLGTCIQKKARRIRFPSGVEGSVYVSWDLGPQP